MPKPTIKKAALITAGYIVGAVLLYVVVSYDLIAAFWPDPAALEAFFPILKENLLFLLAAIAFFASASLVKTLFEGNVSSAVDKVLRGFGVALLAYFDFVFATSFILTSYQVLALHTFLLVIVGSIYYALSSFLFDLQQITLLTVLKFLSVIFVGIILRFAIINFSSEYIQIIADGVTFGAVFAAISVLFYPLKYSDKSAAKKIGGWMSEGTLSKFCLGLTIALYALLVRPYIYGINSNLTMVGEWLTIGMITTAGFLWLRSKLEAISAPLLLQTWTKHQQELNFKSTDELNILAEYIDEFLNYGEKTEILLFLFNFLFERKVPSSDVHETLSELINYQDPRTPHIIFSWDAKLTRKKNVETRFKVLKRIIGNLNQNVLYFN